MIDLSMIVYLYDEPLHPAMAGELVCPAMVEWVGEFDFRPLRTTAIQDDVGYSGDIRCIWHASCLEDR
jgi:hypothetical protein